MHSALSYSSLFFCFLVQVAYPFGSDPTAATVKTVAICAGSGGSMFAGLTADAYFTGEMQHHEVLAAVAKGVNVILCASSLLLYFQLRVNETQLSLPGGHTNTERGYLPIFASNLRQKLYSTDLRELSEDELEYAPLLRVIDIRMSEMDKHPLLIV